MTEHDYLGPQGLRTRGTVLVLPGRGETRRSYARFGTRLAADSYRVRVLAAPDADAGSADRLAAELTAAVTDLGPDLVHPLVLIGSDLGAAALAALVAREETGAAWWPDAVVLAALPGYGTHGSDAWDDELDARTHCAVHRGVLSDDTEVARGTLDRAVPSALLDAAYGNAVDVPHLLLVGDADPYADRAALTSAAKTLPRARLAVVRGGHHDVLNDLQHRSVAAEIVTFLEVLRDGTPLVPIVDVESSAW
ncbi:alpha/beta hydrolase [Cryptosporangium minutisporangium]|uniref:Alpha/beta hydrolase n=1 Tax=Cryptosporangium minutisporangium TaxID=113569 RepID=A0ABP6SXS7_9ACTN